MYVLQPAAHAHNALLLLLQSHPFIMWLTRDFNGKPGWSALLPNPSYASDGTVAIMFAILVSDMITVGCSLACARAAPAPARRVVVLTRVR